MWPDRVSDPGPLTYESGALPTALRGLATSMCVIDISFILILSMGENFLIKSAKMSVLIA